MQKSEMSVHQLATRGRFVDALTKAGWDPRGTETLFAADIGLTPEATLELNGADVSLRFGFFIGQGYLQLDIGHNPEVFEFGLRLYPRADIDTIVAEVIKVQGELDGGSTAALLRAVAPKCRRMVRVDAAGEKVLTGRIDRAGSRPRRRRTKRS